MKHEIKLRVRSSPDLVRPPVRAGELTLKSLRKAFEKAEHSSESRLTKLKERRCVGIVSSAVKEFCRKENLNVAVGAKPNDVPSIEPRSRFKYSSPESGTLLEQVDELRKGESLAIASVSRKGALVGYGVAIIGKDGTKIDIIDVELDARRRSGLSLDIMIGDESFSIGVGHVVVHALLKYCSPPFHTDATNEHSRFIFKSLGFSTATYANGNPCLLELRTSKVD